MPRSSNKNRPTTNCVQAEYFTMSELSEYSRVGICILYKAIRNREVAHMRLGRKVIVSKVDYDTWFKKQTKQPVPYEQVIVQKKQTMPFHIFLFD